MTKFGNISLFGPLIVAVGQWPNLQAHVQNLTSSPRLRDVNILASLATTAIITEKIQEKSAFNFVIISLTDNC